MFKIQDNFFRFSNGYGQFNAELEKVRLLHISGMFSFWMFTVKPKSGSICLFEKHDCCPLNIKISSTPRQCVQTSWSIAQIHINNQ
jgi:hypothetical protein